MSKDFITWLEVKDGKNGRCWDDYKPIPGKKPFEKGSCQPKDKKKKNENFDDFDTQVQSDELPGQNDYEAQQGMQDFSSGMSLTAQEVSEIKELLNRGLQQMDPQAVMQKHDQSFLYKLQALGLL